MKDLKAQRGKFYLQRVIAEGEHEHQDFKFAISDARKIARSLSAFANHGGGRLLVGVKDNGAIAGVRSEEDIYVIEQAAEMYCRPAQSVKFTAFSGDEGAIVIRAEIEASPSRPVQAQEPDGSWRAYYRVADENIVASGLMVKAWRRRNRREALQISLDGEAMALIELLKRRRAIDLEDYMLEARLSRQRAEELVVGMYCLDLVDFEFIDRRFKISLTK